MWYFYFIGVGGKGFWPVISSINWGVECVAEYNMIGFFHLMGGKLFIFFWFFFLIFYTSNRVKGGYQFLSWWGGSLIIGTFWSFSSVEVDSWWLLDDWGELYIGGGLLITLTSLHFFYQRVYYFQLLTGGYIWLFLAWIAWGQEILHSQVWFCSIIFILIGWQNLNWYGCFFQLKSGSGQVGRRALLICFTTCVSSFFYIWSGEWGVITGIEVWGIWIIYLVFRQLKVDNRLKAYLVGFLLVFVFISFSLGELLVVVVGGFYFLRSGNCRFHWVGIWVFIWFIYSGGESGTFVFFPILCELVMAISLVLFLIFILRTSVWGDYELLQFYPRNWSTGYIRSGETIIAYILSWQFWMWFTFVFLINLYFVFLFRTFSYRRADIRGRRGTGDKRRSAWPELFTCFFPLCWCLNILVLSLDILKTVEVNGSFVTLTLQIVGYQWGWRYGYGDMGYLKLLLAPVQVGRGAVIRPGGGTIFFREVLEEVYFVRRCLLRDDKITNYPRNVIKVPLQSMGFWVDTQGVATNPIVIRKYINAKFMYIRDPLRLLRASGTFVLPTRSTIRLLASAEDVIHSWAVPALGLKLDCVPGRLFVSFVNIIREGAYYGQCSELCGWNHFNMPIVLYALPMEHFLVWWEIELHECLLKKITDGGKNYSLFSVKFK